MALDHHVDLALRPSPELMPAVLMSALFGRLHLALVERGTAVQLADPVAVTFPGWLARRPQADERAPRTGATLGGVARLLGTAATLDGLMSRVWLGPMRAYVTVGALAPVPADALPCSLRRVQAKSGVDRLRRRRMRRHGVDESEAARQLPDRCVERLELPFVQLRSASTGQPFRMFLAMADAADGQQRDGVFNTYGLSSDATVVRF